MDENNLPIWGIFAVIIVKFLADALLSRKNGKTEKLLSTYVEANFKALEVLVQEIHDLWEWHNVSDPSTGAKLWYNSGANEKMLDKLTATLSAQTLCLEKISGSLDRIELKVDDIA